MLVVVFAIGVESARAKTIHKCDRHQLLGEHTVASLNHFIINKPSGTSNVLVTFDQRSGV